MTSAIIPGSGLLRHRNKKHTYTSWLVQEEGIPLGAVQEVVGHSTLSMTQRYMHLAPDTMHDASRQVMRVVK